MIIDEATFLEHYGTKGMKWGVRKSDSLKGKALRQKRKENFNKAVGKERAFIEKLISDPKHSQAYVILQKSAAYNSPIIRKGETWTQRYMGEKGKLLQITTNAYIQRTAEQRAYQKEADLRKADRKQRRQERKGG